MTQKALIGTFLGGLKKEIAQEMFLPKSLLETIELSRIQDERLVHQHQINESDLQGTVLILDIVAVASPTPRPSPLYPIKKLSWDEMQRKREKGLCFNFNKQYTPGHKYRTPHVFLIENKESWEVEGISEEESE